MELHAPGVNEATRDSLVRVVRALREGNLRKPPSVSETVDWARTLLSLGADELDAEFVEATLGVLLKHQGDIESARTALKL